MKSKYLVLILVSLIIFILIELFLVKFTSKNNHPNITSNINTTANKTISSIFVNINKSVPFGYSSLSDSGDLLTIVGTLRKVTSDKDRNIAIVDFSGDNKNNQNFIVYDNVLNNKFSLGLQTSTELYADSSSLQNKVIQSNQITNSLEHYINKQVIVYIPLKQPKNSSTINQAELNKGKELILCNQNYASLIKKNVYIIKSCNPLSFQMVFYVL